ncbi:hypothetical protein EJ04DRAFT_560593 [Polyplosphaeria fusca]|uniref:Uncharacterized protein n=1 Tax=Polyplosphaeria fusca TaxID=682080 RepID=A0A9P4R3Q8_9PLEO|nr:hypothetical protein EJ04DRAFT_560593 [Polyplosphaeria fusca]
MTGLLDLPPEILASALLELTLDKDTLALRQACLASTKLRKSAQPALFRRFVQPASLVDLRSTYNKSSIPADSADREDSFSVEKCFEGLDEHHVLPLIKFTLAIVERPDLASAVREIDCRINGPVSRSATRALPMQAMTCLCNARPDMCEELGWRKRIFDQDIYAYLAIVLSRAPGIDTLCFIAEHSPSTDILRLLKYGGTSILGNLKELHLRGDILGLPFDIADYACLLKRPSLRTFRAVYCYADSAGVIGEPLHLQPGTSGLVCLKLYRACVDPASLLSLVNASHGLKHFAFDAMKRPNKAYTRITPEECQLTLLSHRHTLESLRLHFMYSWGSSEHIDPLGNRMKISTFGPFQSVRVLYLDLDRLSEETPLPLSIRSLVLAHYASPPTQWVEKLLLANKRENTSRLFVDLAESAQPDQSFLDLMMEHKAQLCIDSFQDELDAHLVHLGIVLRTWFVRIKDVGYSNRVDSLAMVYPDTTLRVAQEPSRTDSIYATLRPDEG